MAVFHRLLLERTEAIRGANRQAAGWEESLQGAFWRILAASGPGFKNATWAAKLAKVTDKVFEHGQDVLIAKDVEASAALHGVMADEWLISNQQMEPRFCLVLGRA